jgi:hypothetical protein
MSNSVLAAIITPVVAIIALAVWILAVYRAQRNPRNPKAGRRLQPRYEVAGGAFRSEGGRQLMPRRDAVPAEAGDEAPEAVTAAENGEEPGLGGGAAVQGPGPAGLGRRSGPGGS